ncbi:MAG: PSD1 and planctomycete cytochrome C domain-containing protein [Bryobacteraceae bacterium]|nr:PSD1 and planctomycete cytochrome C domain-containing protein [Bryobacteraceae bacterium]
MTSAALLLLGASLLAAAPDFVREVEPILKKNCTGCHGAAVQTSGLRLDRSTDALRGGYSGPAIQPGNAAASKLIQLVEAGKMPPAGKKLAAAEVGILKAWITAGAKFPAETGPVRSQQRTSHWSFQPIRRPAEPVVGNAAWSRNAIDRFVLARLEKERIQPSPEAEKTALLRRLSLDLTGLPPTPAEMEDFLTDTTSGAYERAVERLLHSPHYGEKWARHWLDLARYADSDGYEKDSPRPWAWRYRHWVIDALNKDMGFDRFTIEQLAGDLLPNPTPDQKAAVGFYRNSLTNREGGVDTEEFRIAQVKDRASTVGTTWLGLSVGCAECHDHKYDPISQREFYSLFAFFNQLMDHDVEAPLPGELGPWLAARPGYEASRQAMFASYGGPELMREWRAKLLRAADQPGNNDPIQFAWKYVGNLTNGLQPVLRLEESQRPREQHEQLVDYFIDRAGDVFSKEELALRNWQSLRKEWAALEASAPKITMAQSVRQSFSPRKSHILMRGDFRSPGVEVLPGTMAALPPMKGEANRLNLARWLVSRENPLSARVTVNRVWQEYFGRGLVFTSEDFGARGEKPSHPELLDWLSAEFMESGWRFKHLHRLIVTSSTYRQSSKARHDLKEKDPDNQLLARQTRLRLPAEAIRDSALAAAGLLTPTIGGPGVRPPQPKGVTELSYANSVKWPESDGPDRYRRGLYIFFQRTVPYPQLMTFDSPDAVQACSRRQRSTTPLQALNLLNDPVFLEAAQSLGVRLLREAPPSFDERMKLAFRLCLGRDPKPKEAEAMGRYYQKELAALQANPEEARYLHPQTVAQAAPSEGGAWTVMARVLLNLDEFIHRE